ncbi:hypothetical protein FI667_g9361, partial [Globisporangium splendens]
MDAHTAQRPRTEWLALSGDLLARMDCGADGRLDPSRVLPRSVAVAAADAAAALEYPLHVPPRATPSYEDDVDDAAETVRSKTVQENSLSQPDGAARIVLSPEERDILLSVLEGGGRAIASREKSVSEGYVVSAVDPVAGQESRGVDNCGSASKTSATAEHSSTASAVTTSGDPPAQKPVKKVKKLRRHRYRRKHEVDALRIKVVELVERLESLRERENTLTDATTASGEPSSDSLVASTKVRKRWEEMASSEREQTQRAMIENKRLRAQYEAQLHVIKRFDAMYLNHQVFGELDAWPEIDIIAKRPRLELVDDDFAIFASLGRDFDAQYSKVDSIFQVAGLAGFDGEITHEMQLRRGTNGIFFIENVLSKVVPQDVFSGDCSIWQFASNKEAHMHHNLHEVREIQDGNVRKIVDTIRLPHTDAILTVRTALRIYKEETRFVIVWDSVLEVSGPVFMRFRERGWKLKRRPYIGTTSDTEPVSVEQICIRITPELRGVYVEQDLAAGTLANLLIASYNQHTKQMHGGKLKFPCRTLI